MHSTRRDRTVSSALWSAYGDILGFPTELVNEAGVLRRLGEKTVSLPKKWERMIGGRTGTWVELNAGSYSDDTQLRLATSRAIRADGYFDVEAFAKIELTVWLAYALGAGRGSKVGAAALAQRSVNWFSNFFEQKDVIYTHGGGNGAAMRIQPHVWAAQNLGNPASYLPDVLQNSICTHGHPRGIAGSVIHAVCLAHILNYGEIPPPSDWRMLGSFISVATEYIEENSDLSTFWLPTWNSRTGTHFAEEMEKIRFEWEADVNIAEDIISSTAPDYAYYTLLNKLGGYSPSERGSGIKCALFSLAAAWIHRSNNPANALGQIANSLGSDTDTIATMTGALLGAINPKSLPPGAIQDREYIIQEAERMFAISEESSKCSFTYPDLLSWQPPKSQLEVVGVNNGNMFVIGLGKAKPISPEFSLPKSDASWQWLELSFGQTILCKRRAELSEGKFNQSIGYWSDQVKQKDRVIEKFASSTQTRLEGLEGQEQIYSSSKSKNNAPPQEGKSKNDENIASNSETLDEMTDRVIKSGFSAVEIGESFLKLAELSNGLELSVAYAAVIVKARKARLKRASDENLGGTEPR